MTVSFFLALPFLILDPSFIALGKLGAGVVFSLLFPNIDQVGSASAEQDLESYTQTSSSMAPTLNEGDIILVDTLAYQASVPSRGDIVLFYAPNSVREPDWGFDGPVYVKRVVGLPGDRIRMIGGVLHIDGEPAPRQRIEDYPAADGGYTAPLAQYIETLPNGLEYRIIERFDDGMLDDTEEFHVPDGHYFVLGDNRDNSVDSRLVDVLGFIPRDLILGQVHDRIWPLGSPLGN